MAERFKAIDCKSTGFNQRRFESCFPQVSASYKKRQNTFSLVGKNVAFSQRRHGFDSRKVYAVNTRLPALGKLLLFF